MTSRYCDSRRCSRARRRARRTLRRAVALLGDASNRRSMIRSKPSPCAAPRSAPRRAIMMPKRMSLAGRIPASPRSMRPRRRIRGRRRRRDGREVERGWSRRWSAVCCRCDPAAVRIATCAREDVPRRPGVERLGDSAVLRSGRPKNTAVSGGVRRGDVALLRGVPVLLRGGMAEGRVEAGGRAANLMVCASVTSRYGLRWRSLAAGRRSHAAAEAGMIPVHGARRVRWPVAAAAPCTAAREAWLPGRGVDGRSGTPDGRVLRSRTERTKMRWSACRARAPGARVNGSIDVVSCRGRAQLRRGR